MPVCPHELLETYGSRLVRDPERIYIHTEYELRNGLSAGVLWLGEEVFFFVSGTGSKATPESTGILGVRLPTSHSELPPWVVPLMEEQWRMGSTAEVEGQLDAYLSLFTVTSASVSPSTRILRSIHWGSLPLHWQPVCLRNLPLRVSRKESMHAQARLMRNLGASFPPDDLRAGCDALWHTARGCEATALLGQITGLQ
jgi:hypothetical protein